MIPGTIYNTTSNKTVLNKVFRTETYLERARGLLGKPQLQEGEGLLIVPCNSIHTFFMGYPIDVLFLDKEFRIHKICTALKPWRLTAYLSSYAVLELASCTTNNLSLTKADQLIWKPSDQSETYS